jgi:hypothetical protein
LPEDWLRLLVERCWSPEGPVSIAACRALSTLHPEGFDDLRPEVWSAWLQERDPEWGAPSGADIMDPLGGTR